MLAQLKKHLTLRELWSDVKFFFLLNLGLVATAVGIAVFKTPNHFAFGGTSGLSIVLATLFPRWNVGAFMWFINAALVALGFVFLGVRSMGWTIYSSFALSFYVSLCERVYPLSRPLTDDVFLELCFAVILSAVGAAIVFNIGASTGGTDIVAMILNKYASRPRADGQRSRHCAGRCLSLRPRHRPVLHFGHDLEKHCCRQRNREHQHAQGLHSCDLQP